MRLTIVSLPTRPTRRWLYAQDSAGAAMDRYGQRWVSEEWDIESQDEKGSAMKKSIALLLTDEELQDLYRILIDRDAEEALCFLNQHLRKKVRQALEGG